MKIKTNDPPTVPDIKLPRYLHFQLTERCNLACPGCYLPDRSGGWSDPERVDREVFAPLAEAGVRYATLTGGEPLLHPQWFRICTLAAQRFDDVQIVSNGLLLDLPAYEALRHAGVRAIKVSLDGATPEIHDALRGKPGSFERTVANLQAITSLPPEQRGSIDVGCICTVHETNVHQLREIASFVGRIGLNSILFQPYHPYGLLYPPSGELIRPSCDQNFLDELNRQLDLLRDLRRNNPGFMDNSIAMLKAFPEFYTRPDGPRQTCGANRFVFVNSALQVRGCLFSHSLGAIGVGIQTQRRSQEWTAFDSFRSACQKCLMGCQFIDQAKDMTESGFDCLKNERPHQAKIFFDASLALDFSVPAAHGAGIARLRLGQAQEALDFLLQASTHRPLDAFIQGDIADTLLQLKKPKEARSRLEALLDIHPNHPFILEILGEILLRLQDWASLNVVLLKLAKIPEARIVYCRLNGLSLKAHDSSQNALPFLREVALADPNPGPWPAFEYGLTCLELNLFEEAVHYIGIATQRDPAFPWFHFRLAQALVGLGRTTVAMEECQKALEITPDEPKFIALLTELREKEASSISIDDLH